MVSWNHRDLSGFLGCGNFPCATTPRHALHRAKKKVAVVGAYAYAVRYCNRSKHLFLSLPNGWLPLLLQFDEQSNVFPFSFLFISHPPTPCSGRFVFLHSHWHGSNNTTDQKREKKPCRCCVAFFFFSFL